MTNRFFSYGGAELLPRIQYRLFNNFKNPEEHYQPNMKILLFIINCFMYLIIFSSFSNATVSIPQDPALKLADHFFNLGNSCLANVFAKTFHP